MMPTITPCLTFDRQAEEAVRFYAAALPGSEILRVTRCGEGEPQPAGSVRTVRFKLCGQELMAANGGPPFTFTPAVSLFVHCETAAEVDAIWEPLADGGTVLMPLDAYPFASRFGWVQDRFGVSWQVLAAPGRQRIVPGLLFVGERHGRAEEAVNRYLSLFADSGIVELRRHAEGSHETAGTVEQARFSLSGYELSATDGGLGHAFTFSPGISLYVGCDTQAEVDRLWDGLCADGEPQPCGWLVDRFGVSWQVAPTIAWEMVNDPDPAASQRVVDAVLRMKKLDLDALKRAYAGG
jgi:predicted 3-demethylubiquinone-9 3-methyltransferase (glyoxalase superfamily)